MSDLTLVFLLEEPSAREALKGLLPRILPEGVAVRYLVYEGKQDLERRMARQIRAWRVPNSRFVVLRDQDCGDCRKIKRQLQHSCQDAGQGNALVRIACRELEAWFIGDWEAVARAFEKPKLARLSNKAMYKSPDQLSSPVGELRKQIPVYQKVDGARRIGPHLDPSRSLSPSFRAFTTGVKCLVGM